MIRCAECAAYVAGNFSSYFRIILFVLCELLIIIIIIIIPIIIIIKNLSIAWIDYQKAFDSVPLSWVEKSIELVGG